MRKHAIAGRNTQQEREKKICLCECLPEKRLTQVNDVPLMHVLDSLAHLPHVIDHFSFGHGVTLFSDLLEQLSAGQAGIYAGH